MINKEDIAFIVIGDVHGRKFWMDAVGYEDTVPVVFLGDYLDPYPDEPITQEEAFDNFKEVLEYARNNQNVHLLYGNHDSYAFRDDILCSCRHDYVRYDDIFKLFHENKDLFKFAHDEHVNGKRFLMTHAGIHPKWIEANRDIFGDDFKWTADEINAHAKEEGFMKALRTYSWRRGGFLTKYASMVWCDIGDHLDVTNKGDYDGIPENLVQVFGHTRSIMAAGFEEYCRLFNVDCKRVVFIDKTGTLRYLDDGSPVMVFGNQDEDNK